MRGKNRCSRARKKIPPARKCFSDLSANPSIHVELRIKTEKAGTINGFSDNLKMLHALAKNFVSHVTASGLARIFSASSTNGTCAPSQRGFFVIVSMDAFVLLHNK